MTKKIEGGFNFFRPYVSGVLEHFLESFVQKTRKYLITFISNAVKLIHNYKILIYFQYIYMVVWFVFGGLFLVLLCVFFPFVFLCLTIIIILVGL